MDYSTSYAGFGKRLIAYILDSIITFIPVLVIYFVLVSVVFAVAPILFFSGNEAATELVMNLANIIGSMLSPLAFMIQIVFFAWFESSERQATPGKKALGIKVTGMQGERISFTKAATRNLGRIFCSILLIGYLIIEFSQKKQGLHDMIAGCLVVDANAN